MKTNNDLTDAAREWMSENPTVFDVIELPNGQTEGEGEFYCRMMADFAAEQLAEKDREIERLKTALEQYADKSNWTQSPASIAFDESALDVVGGNAPHFQDMFNRIGNGYDIAFEALAEGAKDE